MNMQNLCYDIMRYLAGEYVDFMKYDLDLTHLTKFQREVLEATRKIPYGQTRTYGQLAEDIGKSKASRAVGRVLNKNPYPLVIPCHRVVAKNSIGGYAGGKELKKKLLEMEKAIDYDESVR
ncbi:methylated-DNA/protein-cysteinemethyltransferase [Methanohalophilus mahii DSM 5219]|uniref:methylated-DNA--[protein]-cysteine S-methyltransferase n=2 Tax=Methanohalophilus mahii TaxID=2176 RepID=D5E867_METMS|nr:methylated-DNA/protein-cysteinemethyltransferase [Methanohalophilus mahii DSM 5219]